MNEISEKYKKYIVGLKLNGEDKLLVSGMDITNEYKDFLLLDKDSKVLLFNDFSQIEEYILNEELLDNNNLQSWVKELKNKKPYVSYNIDNILNAIEKAKDLRELNKDMLSQIVDFINIIGDYAYQINKEDLIVLYEHQLIDQFKELFMNDFIWKLEVSDEAGLNTVPWESFRTAFEKLYNLFKQCFSPR